MKKILSLTYKKNTLYYLKKLPNIFVENTLVSCLNIHRFLCCKEPLFPLKLFFVLASNDHDLNSKVKTVIGNAMIGTGAEMLCKLFNITSDEQHKGAMELSSIMINFGFCFLTGQGIVSKFEKLFQKSNKISDIEEGNQVEMDKIKKLLGRQVLSEIDFFLTSCIVMGSAIGSLIGKLPEDDNFSRIFDFLGVMKAFNYIVGHLNSLYQHKAHFEELNDESREYYKNNIHGLWYSSDGFNMNYLQAGVSTNIVMGAFAATALIAGCDGPKGPSGEASCTKGSNLEICLLIFHIFSMNWLGGSLLKPATTSIKFFPIKKIASPVEANSSKVSIEYDKENV